MVLLKGNHWNTIDVHDLRWFKGIFSKNTFLNNPISFPKNKSLKRLTDFIDETSRKPWTRIVSNGTWERLPIRVETLQKTCPAQFRTQHQNRPRCATGMYTLQQTFAVQILIPKPFINRDFHCNLTDHPTIQFGHEKCEYLLPTPRTIRDILYHYLFNFPIFRQITCINGLVDGKIYRKPWFLPWNIGLSCRFSLKPIQWLHQWMIS